MKKTLNDIVRAVLYIRVSSEEQVKHGYSLQSQRERLIEYSKQKGYQVIDIYVDEGKSARSKLKNRTELLRLIEDAKLRKFDRIIFWRLDRWFRNIADYYKIQEILDSNKIDWECSDEEYSTTTSNGRLHLNIKLSIAQNESDQTSDRIKFNFENMIKNGRAIQGSQCQPFGYIVGGEVKNKRVIKDTNVEHIVYDMFNYLKKCGSVNKTARYINEKYELKILYNDMRMYFKNTKYFGSYRNNDNYCEPYITKEEYNEIQSILKHNNKNNKKQDYIFSSLLKCPKCGYKLAGGNHRGKYIFYKCNNHYNNHLCNFKERIKEKELEKYLLENIEDEIHKLIKNSEEAKKQEEKSVKKNDKEKTKAKLARLTELYLDDMILREKYDIEFQKLTALLKESENEPKEKEYDLSTYNDFLNTNGLEIYNNLNNTSKRLFWCKYIEYIIPNDDKTFRIIFK